MTRFKNPSILGANSVGRSSRICVSVWMRTTNPGELSAMEREKRVDDERNVLLHQRGGVLEREGQDEKRRELVDETLPETKRRERFHDEEVE